MQNIEELVKKSSIILWTCDFNGIITLQIGGGLGNTGMGYNFEVGKSIYDILKGSEGFFEAFKIVLEKKENIEALYKFNDNYCQMRMSCTTDVILGVCSLENEKVLRDKMNAIDFTVSSTEKFKKDYLAVISHEIRTPLNGITGVLNLIKTDSPDSSSKKYIDVIQRSVNTLLGLVNDILDFSKMENGKMDIQIKLFNLHHIIDDVTILFFHNASEKNIRINSNIDFMNKKKMYLGDPKRITQILNNLLSNAVKFTPKNGNIHVEIIQTENNTKIRVIDSGMGISELNKDKLFKPYSQIGFQTGTGLGLSICKSLVELMDGDIGYINNPSTFWVDLPLKESNESESISNSTSPTLMPIMGPIPKINIPIKTKTKILIAEDDNINNLVLCKYLHRLGFLDVVSKKNGRDVYQALEDSVKTNDRFDYVLLDNKMPYMSGTDVSEKFLPLKTKEKIILVSGEHQESKVSGIDSIILKPYNITEIEKELK